MEALKQLLETIRATHPDVRSVLLVGREVVPSRRETPLWPCEDVEVRDEDGCRYELASDELGEQPPVVARYADGVIEVEHFADVPAASDDPRHLVLVLPAFDYDENESAIAAIDASQLDRVTLLRDGYMGSWIDLPTDLEVPTIALGFCKEGRQVGWQLVHDRGRYTVSLVAFDEEATLDALAGMLHVAESTPIVFERSACFQPTAEDAAAVSVDHRPVVLTEEERVAMLRAREAERAQIAAELAAEAEEEAKRAAARFSASDCTAFVVYAIPSRHAAVEAGLPHIVLREADELLEHFGRYPAPYPLELSGEQLAERLDRIPRDCAVMVDVVRDFATAYEGSWFICVLEPPAIAGDGTAIDRMGP